MRFVLGITVVLTILGCGIIRLIAGSPQLYIKRDVQVSELVGTWNVTAHSEASLDKWVKRDPNWGIHAPWRSIILKNDGTCEAKLERAWVTKETALPKEAITIDTLPCSWQITKISSIENEDVLGVDVDLDESNSYIYGPSLYLFEDNGELILWTFIGDPDDFSLQEFTKSQK